MWFGRVRHLLAGGNWNNAGNAGVGYLNANNTASITNANIGSQLELRIESDPEQRPDPNQDLLVKHTTTQPEVLVLLGTLFRIGRARS